MNKATAEFIKNLWPVFLIFFMALFSKKINFKSFTKADLSLVFLAVLGSSVIASGENSLLNLDFTEKSFTPFFAALSAGVYFSLNKFLQEKITRITKTDNNFKIGNFVLFIVISFAVIISSSYSIFVSKESLAIAPEAIFYSSYLGIFILGIGHALYVYALKNVKNPITVPMLAYFTPFLALVWLHFFFEPVISPKILVGGVLITLANLMIQIKKKHINATLGAAIFSVCFPIIMYVYRSNFNGALDGLTSAQNVGVLAAIFAILTGFTLFRVHERTKKEEELLLKVGAIVDSILAKEGSKEAKSLFDDLLQKLIDYDFNPNFKTIGLNSEAINSSMNEILKKYQKSSKIEKEIEELKEALMEWLYMRSQRMPVGENLTIWSFGFLTIGSFFINQDPTLIGDIATLIFGCSIFFACLTIRDLDLNQPERNFTQIIIMQTVFERNKLDYYVPRKIAELDLLPSPKKKMKFRYYDENGKIKYYEKIPDTPLQSNLKTGLYLSGISIGALLLTLHYYPNILG